MHPFFSVKNKRNKESKKMKHLKFSYMLLAVLALMFVVACTEKKKEPVPMGVQAEMELSAEDTTAVQELADSYMELLKNKQYDEAMQMLYYVDSLQDIIPIPEVQKQNTLRMLQTFPVLDYHCDGIIFHKEMDSQIKYTIEFFEKDPEHPEIPNTTAMYLKPMRKDGKWYLTVYDTASHNGPASEIQ